MADKFEKTDKNILDFYNHETLNYMKTRLDGVIYHDKINNVLYQQNTMKLNTKKGGKNSKWITISEDFQYRPDKLAYVVYGNELLYWVIMQHNNIIDPFELELGVEIELPSLEEVNPAFDIRKEVTAFKKLKK